jgi:hypothetical protein
VVRKSFIRAVLLLALIGAAIAIAGANCVGLLTGGGGGGETTGTIKGKVVDKDTKAPIAGAVITTEPTATAEEIETAPDGTYVILEVEPDSYTVTASKEGYTPGSKFNVVVQAGGEATANIELTPTVESVEVEPPSATIEVGETLTLEATVTYGNDSTDDDVEWSSSDESVAKVEDGIVTGLTVGSVTITATSKKDATKSASAEITVVASTATPTPTPTVTPSPTATVSPTPSATVSPTPSATASPTPTPVPSGTISSVTVSPASSAITTGATLNLTATVSGTGSFNTAVNWSVQSGGPGGTVSPTTGSTTTFTAPASSGTTIVRATAAGDGTKFADATITITLAPGKFDSAIFDTDIFGP